MSKVILTAFGERVKKACGDKVAVAKAIRAMQGYFDRHNEIIFDSGPGKRLIFGHADQEVIFDLTGIMPEEVENVMLGVKVIDKSWKLLNTPFVILSVLCIREFESRKMVRERDQTIMFLAMKFFSSRQRRSFPFEPNPNIMAYTINNLSEKFKYKKLQNNYNVVKDTVMTSHQTYTRMLLAGEDEMFLTYVPQMENRIGKIMNAVAEEFYRNRDQKNYLNTDQSFDDEGNSKEGESLSGTISGLSEAIAHDFVSQKVNMGLVRIVSERNNLPFTTMYQALNEIRLKESPQTIITMFRRLFNVLIEIDKTVFERVCSKDFATTALRQLTVSNTSNEDLLELKKDLDGLLDRHCVKYQLTERAATKMAYRSALYGYLVYLLVIHKCR